MDATGADLPKSAYRRLLPPVTFCAAIGTQDDDAEGFILVYQSGRWGGGASDNFTYLTSVSCADETLCVAVDTQSRAYVYDGRTWTPEVVGNGETSFEAVSCASPAFCVATGNSFALYKAWALDPGPKRTRAGCGFLRVRDVLRW